VVGRRALVSEVELPHLASPFQFDAKGRVETVEQGTGAEIASCVYNIAVCPEGFRVDLPAFGAPDLAFSTLPLDIASLEGAFRRWEPRADLTLTAQAEALDAAQQRVTVEVS
jgi:phage baseplate assembly protein W